MKTEKLEDRQKNKNDDITCHSIIINKPITLMLQKLFKNIESI